MTLALRPRQTPERLAAAFERAQRAGELTRIELGALTAPEARSFWAERVDVADATTLYEESGGNPSISTSSRSLDRAGPANGFDISLTAIGVPPRSPLR
jgi:hypothetical protein